MNRYLRVVGPTRYWSRFMTRIIHCCDRSKNKIARIWRYSWLVNLYNVQLITCLEWYLTALDSFHFGIIIFCLSRIRLNVCFVIFTIVICFFKSCFRFVIGYVYRMIYLWMLRKKEYAEILYGSKVKRSFNKNVDFLQIFFVLKIEMFIGIDQVLNE